MSSGRNKRRVALASAGVVVLLAAPGAPAADPSLRADADRAAIRFGTALQSKHLADAAYAGLVARQVNTITFENEAKWATVHPAPGVYDFAKADALARWARDQGMTMRGHTLLWHVELPAWLRELKPTREEAIALLHEHITTVVGHFRTAFPGLVTQWDVVNEGIDNDGSRRQSVWQRWIGDDYIELAFRFARAAAGPEVQLFYNDYFDTGMIAGAELLPQFDDGDPLPMPSLGASGPLGCDVVLKCARVRELVTRLKTKGVPIDGVGFQAHMADPLPSDHRALTSWVGKLGLRWALTEMDVPVPPGAGVLTGTQQAGAFATATRACVDDPACDTVVLWGLSDRYSWWQDLLGGALGDALPWDAALRAKPAVAALHGVLAAAPAAPPSPQRCAGRRTVTIRLPTRVIKVVLRVPGRRARTLRGPRRSIRVSLRGPRGSTVTVRLTVHRRGRPALRLQKRYRLTRCE